jgi:predicted HTH transcriptional regulator
MDIGLSIRECDPWATYVDIRTKERAGQKGAEGLSEMERKVYEMVKDKGRATREEVMKALELSGTELQLQLIPLMHGDLVKEIGEGGTMYLIVPSSE